jgi:O-antigen ligase
MGFVLTVLYVTLSLVSPGVLPEGIMSLHVNIILGVLTILACIPSVAKSRIGFMPDLYLLLGMLTIGAIAMVLTGWVGGLIPMFFGFLPIAFAFPFVAISCSSLKRIKILVSVLLLVALFIFSRGYLAMTAGDYASPYILTEGVGGASLYRFRGLGVLADPNDLGQFFVALIPLTWLWWKKGKTLRNVVFTLMPAAALGVALFYTHSRGGALALMAVIWFSLRKKLGTIGSSILSAGALLAVLALNVAGNRGLDEDDGGRVAAWALGLELFKSHPLFGVGMDNFHNFNDTGLTAHNSYILCLAELGLLGYLCWLGMIVFSWQGLSFVIRKWQPEAIAEIDDPDEDPSFAYHLQPSMALAGLPGSHWEQASREPVRQELRQAGGVLPFAASGISGALGDPPAPPDIEEFARSGRILQASLVGLLASAFFISRTYSMTIFILLGLVTAFRIVEIRAHPESQVNIPAIFRQIVWVALGSIVFLYIFVRLHGV